MLQKTGTSDLTMVAREGWIACIAVFALAGLFCRPLWLRCAAFAILGAALIFSSRSHQRTAWESWNAWATPKTRCVASGRVTGNSVQRGGSFHTIVRLDSLYDNTGNVALKGKSIICVTDAPLPSPASFSMQGVFRPPQPRVNPESFDQYAHFMCNGLWGVFYADSVRMLQVAQPFMLRALRAFRSYAMTVIARMDNSNSRALMQAAFLGETGGLHGDLKQRFREAGIYHLLALSGFHVALVISFISGMLFFVPLPRKCKICVALSVAWLYLALAGPIPSLFRATSMATVILASLLAQRRSVGLNALGIAGMVWLVFSPESIASPSYQLSFAATAGLMILTPVFMDITRQWGQRIPALKPLLSTVQVTTACFLATAPILAYHFGTISMFGFIANLAAATLMAIALWAFFGALLVAGISSHLAQPAMLLAQYSLQWLDAIGRIAQMVSWRTIEVLRPHAEMLIAAVLLLTGLGAIRRELRWRFLIPAGLLSIIIGCVGIGVRRATAQPRIVFFSTKEKPVAGVVWPSHKVWIIGWDKENQMASTYRAVIGPWLRGIAYAQLDAVVLGADCDELTPKLEAIMEVCRPRRIIIAGSLEYAHRAHEACACAKQLRKILCSMLAPSEEIAAAPGCLFRVIQTADSAQSLFSRFAIEIRINRHAFLLGDPPLESDDAAQWSVIQKPTAASLRTRYGASTLAVSIDPTLPYAVYAPLRDGAVTVFAPLKKKLDIRMERNAQLPLYAGLRAAHF